MSIAADPPRPDATLKQRSAADPTASVWVAASAGSGKTTVLTNRVLSLLLDGTLPERILCLTFTKAAAAVMANRVHEKLGEWVVADYKSDRVSSREAADARAELYASQGAIYTRAVQDALGLALRPRFELWFLHADHVVVCGTSG